jgi:hypothetical protein
MSRSPTARAEVRISRRTNNQAEIVRRNIIRSHRIGELFQNFVMRWNSSVASSLQVQMETSQAWARPVRGHRGARSKPRSLTAAIKTGKKMEDFLIVGASPSPKKNPKRQSRRGPSRPATNRVTDGRRRSGADARKGLRQSRTEVRCRRGAPLCCGAASHAAGRMVQASGQPHRHCRLLSSTLRGAPDDDTKTPIPHLISRLDRYERGARCRRERRSASCLGRPDLRSLGDGQRIG